MTRDEIQEWVQGYRDIEKVILWHIKQDDPSARWLTVSVEDGRILAEYAAYCEHGPTRRYEDRYTRYTAEDMAAMFDHVRDMEQYWEQDSWPWHEEEHGP